MSSSQLKVTEQVAWYGLHRMTSSKGTICRATGPLCGEFTGLGEFPTQRPVTQSFDVFFDLRLNKPLSKQPWGWWFETPPWSLLRQCNEHCTSQCHNSSYTYWSHSGMASPIIVIKSIAKYLLTALVYQIVTWYVYINHFVTDHHWINV